jgi:soluble cytochrome b562
MLVSGNSFSNRGAAMKETVKKAQKILKDVMKELEPAKEHAVGAGREFLLAMRSAIDAEINMLDKASKRKGTKEPGGEGQA